MAINTGTGVVTLVPTTTESGTGAISTGGLTASSYTFAYGGPNSNTNQIIANATSALTSYQSATDEDAIYPLGHLFLAPDASYYAGTWIVNTFNDAAGDPYPPSF